MNLHEKLVKEKKKVMLDHLETAISPDDEDKERNHLGMSEIGDDCRRKLYLSFRKFFKVKFEPRIKRIFAHGKKREVEIIEALKKHFEVWDMVDGKQIECVNEYNKHFRGSVDLIIKIYDEVYVGEIKTYNKSRFSTLVKDGVKRSDYKYYAQVQCYMHELEIDKTLLIAECKDNSELHFEIIDREETGLLYEGLEKKANEITTGTLSNFDKFKETDFRCKMCNYSPFCHGGNMSPLKHCKTCVHCQADHEGFFVCYQEKGIYAKKLRGFEPCCNYEAIK